MNQSDIDVRTPATSKVSDSEKGASKSTLLILVSLLCVVLGVWFWKFVFPLSQKSTMLIYTHPDLGFTLRYPRTIVPEHAFHPYFHLGNSWRYSATSTGTPLVVFPVLRIDEDPTLPSKSYPRFYVAEVRVGMSRDANDVSRCESADTMHGETVPPRTRSLGNGIWKESSINISGVEEYLTVQSYRTVRSNNCFAVEVLVSGSSYLDDSMSIRVPSSVLEHALAQSIEIAESIRFP